MKQSLLTKYNKYIEKINKIFFIVKHNYKLYDAYNNYQYLHQQHLKYLKIINKDKGLFEAQVYSNSDDKIYDVTIDLEHDIYYCTCNSYVFLRYPIDNINDVFWRNSIAICKHILFVLNRVSRYYMKMIQ